MTRRNEERAAGLVIRFTREVHVLTPGRRIDAAHVFQVLMRHQTAEGPFLDCLCPIRGEVIPVDNIKESPDRFIVEAQETDKPTAPGVAFIFEQNDLDFIRRANELWVHLRGDFVVDVEEERAIDAEFVRAELPTGDRAKGSEFGIQGGHFESWLRIAPDNIGPSFRLDLNRATPEELMQLPGVDERIARQIVTRRQRAPFMRIEDLTQIRGLTAEFVEVIRDLATTD